MSEIYSATYNIPFNNKTDILFRTSCAHLYHFLHINDNQAGKSTECKPITFKMHLEFNNSLPPMEKNEEKNSKFTNSNITERQSVQQLEAKIKTLEDTLEAKDAVVNKLKNPIEKLVKNISDYEKIIALLSSSVQKHEAKLKSLEDSFQLISEKRLSNNLVDNASDVRNSTTQENSIEKEQQPSKHSNSNKQIYNQKNGNVDGNDNKDVANASGGGHHTTAKEKQKCICDDNNWIVISNLESDSSELSAFINVLGQENSIEKEQQPIKHSNSNKQIYNEKNGNVDGNDNKDVANASGGGHHTTAKEKQKCICDDNNWIVISNLESDSSELSAFINVSWLAARMGFKLTSDQIVCIEVFKQNHEYVTYYVKFRTKNIKDTFVRQKDVLKKFKTTKTVRIIDETEHKCVLIRSLKSFDWNMKSAIDNIMEIAKKMELLITYDQIERIDVDGINEDFVYYCVYFTNKDMADAFLKNKHILTDFPETRSLKIIPF